MYFTKNEILHIYSNDKYPCMKYIFDNRKIIIDEFYKNIIASSKWSNWIEYDKMSNTPIFSKMSPDDILIRMKENNCELNKGKPSWKIFGLMLYGNEIKENVKLCKKTMKILNRCGDIVNAGFSCLEPSVITELHHDFNHDILRCHIPIIIPEGATAIKINNEIIKWNMDKYFIFDDTYDHQAWNFTNKIRVVLILDIKR
jgi:aspartyl/asparaginyl beta-hydroxylase (cupin superfamily)